MKSKVNFQLMLKGKHVELVKGADIPKEAEEHIRKQKPEWIVGNDRRGNPIKGKAPAPKEAGKK